MRVLTLADLFGKLVLWPISAPQHPEENDNEVQQDEDKVKKAHDGADDGTDPSWELIEQRALQTHDRSFVLF